MARVTKLELDLGSGALDIEASLRHRLSWDVMAGATAQVEQWLSQARGEIGAKVDALEALSEGHPDQDKLAALGFAGLAGGVEAAGSTLNCLRGVLETAIRQQGMLSADLVHVTQEGLDAVAKRTGLDNTVHSLDREWADFDRQITETTSLINGAVSERADLAAQFGQLQQQIQGIVLIPPTLPVQVPLPSCPKVAGYCVYPYPCSCT